MKSEGICSDSLHKQSPHEKVHKITNRFEKKDNVLAGYLIQDLEKSKDLTEILQKSSQIGFSKRSAVYEGSPRRVRLCIIGFNYLRTGLAAVCIGLLAIYIIKLENLKQELLCHPCIDLSLKEHSHRCKFDTRKFQEHLARKFRVDTSETRQNLNSCYSRCSARLVLQGDIQSDSNSHGAFQTIKGWSYFAQNTHIALECITPDEDFSSFKISEGGTYLISVQLSFFADDELLKKELKKHLFVGQRVLSNDYQLMQQSSLVSVPQLEEGQLLPGCGENRGSLHVSTLTGIIDLETGENLTISANPVNWLCRWKSASFFSLYRIG